MNCQSRTISYIYEIDILPHGFFEIKGTESLEKQPYFGKVTQSKDQKEERLL